MTDRASPEEPSLRILQVHNTYRQAGGEDVVVEKEKGLLAERGHQVFQELAHNDDIEGPIGKLAVALRTPYSRAGYLRMAAAIRRDRPDVVHVHNFFPLLTPAIFDACEEAGVPAVQTLHNYRAICAAAMLLRDGRPCEDCIGHSPYRAVLHKCYRNSRLGSLAVARMIDRSRRQRIWHTKIDVLVALTEFSRNKFIEAGLPEERIRVKPNFVPDPGDGADDREGALFVGRLSAEKGIRTLLAACAQFATPLKVIGGGPLYDDATRANLPDVSVTGQLPLKDVIREMKLAAFLVFPSEWYEGLPMTIIQAFSCGLPVIASRLGSMVELVEDGVTGLHFNPADPADLAAKVNWAAAHRREMLEMGRNARQAFKAQYSGDATYPMLLAIYQEAIAGHQAHKRP